MEPWDGSDCSDLDRLTKGPRTTCFREASLDPDRKPTLGLPSKTKLHSLQGRATSTGTAEVAKQNARQLASTIHSSVRSIMFVTFYFPPEIGGVNTRISHYVGELRKRDIAVTVFVFTNHATKMYSYQLDGAEIFVCPSQFSFFGRSASHLARIAFSKHIDVMHVFTGPSTAIGFFALCLGRLMRVPSAITFFGTEMFDKGLLQRILQPCALSLATSISVNSPHTGTFIPSALQGKTHVLLGGAEASESIRASFPEMVRGPILFVGRLVERKGGDDLIRAFLIVSESIPGSKLVFVGDGPERERLIELVKRLNLGNDVEFRGALTGQSLHDAYEESSVVVLPSKHVEEDSQIEGLGLTLIEGSMHGKPLVGTRHGGIPDVIEDGVNGFLVPENNPTMLAEAILRIVSNEELARRLGGSALEIARKRFNWGAATDRLLESYLA